MAVKPGPSDLPDPQRRRLLRWTALLFGASRPPARAAQAGGRARVVVIGGGFAGACCALELRRLAPRIAVTLIDPADPYYTCPMSNEVLAGLRTLPTLAVARTALERAAIRVLRTPAVGIDAARRRVHLADHQVLPYDRLVVAPGIRLLWGTPQGYDEEAAVRLPHAWKAGAQTALLAAQLRAMDEGGVVAIAVPRAPFRCPPGPYERASLIAHFLARHKPRAKVLVYDANNRMPHEPLFREAWQALYPGRIEWIPQTAGGEIQRVDVKRRILYAGAGAQRVAVANIIPPQAPGALALRAGLARGHGWCPVWLESFESTEAAGVHVIGDACIAEPMPKSATAACSQAQHCAQVIVATLAERALPPPALDNLCYMEMAPDYAVSTRAAYALAGGSLQIRTGSDRTSPLAAAPQVRAGEARAAQAWYAQIRAQAFGA
jgi:sulfide dehydrogenase [flavocytochrome c] flavoprotein subunit